MEQPETPGPITPRTTEPKGNATERRVKKTFWVGAGLLVALIFVLATGLFSQIAPPPSPSSARAQRAQESPDASAAGIGQTRSRLANARPAGSPSGVTLTFGAKVENGQDAAGREDTSQPASVVDSADDETGREASDTQTTAVGGYVGGAGSPQDAERDERRRLERQSLFAGSLVDLKRKNDPQQGRLGGAPPPPPQFGEENPLAGLLSQAASTRPSLQIPSADELVQSVVREMRKGQAPTPGGGVDSPAGPVATTEQPQMAPPVPHVPPPGHHRVYTDQILDVTLLNRLTGDAPGPVIGALAFPVYAKDGTKVLPKGAQLVGLAQQADAEGQTRVGVGFHRVIVIQPDGYTVKTYSLDQFPGMNQIGDVGLRGEVNRHYLRTFGLAAMVGIVTAVPTAITNGINGGVRNNGVVFAGGMADATGQSVGQTLNRLMALPWELTIPEGKRLKVAVMADLDLPAYVDRPLVTVRRTP